MASPEQIKKQPTKAEQSPTGEKTEKIKSPAVRYEGKVYAERHHLAARTQIQNEIAGLDPASKEAEAGFLTTGGRFLRRKDPEVLEIALANNQVRNPASALKRGYLYSHDLQNLPKDDEGSGTQEATA
jgi:hypothetical protein